MLKSTKEKVMSTKKLIQQVKKTRNAAAEVYKEEADKLIAQITHNVTAWLLQKRLNLQPLDVMSDKGLFDLFLLETGAITPEMFVDGRRDTRASQISGSTSAQSEEELKKSGRAGEVDAQIHRFIHKNPGVTRSEIAKQTGIRIQTVCGAVNRLMFDGLVEVTGITKDLETNRNVETLEITEIT